MIRAAWIAVVIAMLVMPAYAQTSQSPYAGVCEDIFVPAYPAPNDAGTAIEDFGKIQPPILNKAAADCARRGNGFFPGAKVKLAHARMQALGGDIDALPLLRKLSGDGVPEAGYLIYMMYLQVPQKSLVNPNTEAPLRAEAERELRAAARGGHPLAIYSLGRNFASGMLVRQDLKEARIWIDKAISAYPANSEKRAWANVDIVELYQSDPASTAQERDRIASIVKAIKASPVADFATWLEVRGRRLGIGWPKDVAAARKLAETSGLIDKLAAMRGEYLRLLRDSADPSDHIRIVEILERAKPGESRSFDTVTGEMLFDGVPAGRDRKRALDMLQSMASLSHERAIAFARAAVASGSNVKVRPQVLQRLHEAADLDVPGGAIALLELRQSTATDAHDGAEAIGLEARFAGTNDDVALAVLEKAAAVGAQLYQYPFDTPEKAVAAIEKYIARNMPVAHRVKAIALRSGKIMPQDDVAATKELMAAAEGGDAKAMKLLADAYSSGKGIAKNNAEELRWMLAAVKAGLVDAQRSLVFFLPFRSAYETLSVHDLLVSAIVLYGDGLSFYDLPSGFDSVFRFGMPGSEIDQDYLARSVMDGFRASMGARNDETVVKVFKAVKSQELSKAVEVILRRENYLSAEPDGFMGPAARTALISWARDKGLPAMEADRLPDMPLPDARLTGVPLISEGVIARLRDRAFADVASQQDGGNGAAMKTLLLLADYGDMQPRAALLKLYSDSAALRKILPPGMVALYGLDVMLTKPPQAEKASIDFIFAMSELYRARSLAIAGEVVLMTLRDDPRLKNRKAFDEIADQFMFVPGFCDALGGMAAEKNVPGIERQDPCSAPSRKALMAWAAAAGPYGAEAVIRKRAAEAILKLPK